MAPLRPLLKADAVFPPNQAQLDAIEMMKKLVVEDHMLAVPDERSASAAARAWMNGDVPIGCPCEAGADTSKIAMGGVLGQASEPGGIFHILMYWSAPLSPAQSQWHIFQQDCCGINPAEAPGM